ncbi:hypothetical protein O2W18_20990 [Modestobacter sp. VKM Ac-2983]|uniref:DUF4760 domain-containing protein n=1 Tax=Modestobacter sp. VKM Ac-2983 TaxID=3004137 RepID=UPI0022AB73AC|nr:hypothetical protein [Modestobacter sp. VKM Ac-2983]MCZ2807590.1 hypothetical protein [Modestobacter sp. VKM Ac-2983]
MDLVDAAPIVISLIALAVSVLSSRRALRATRASHSLTVVTDVLDRLHEPQYADAVKKVREGGFLEGIDPDGGYDAMPGDKRALALWLTEYFDDLGKLVAYGVIDEDLVLGSYGNSIDRSWTTLRGFIYAQRRFNGTQFNSYFEHLAQLARKRPPAIIHKKLGLLKDPSMS